MDSSKTALAVLCGAVGGCILGAGYMLWREHHRGHGHGPFTEGEFDNIWAHTQYGEEEKELMEKTISFKEGLEYYSKIFELCSKYKNVRKHLICKCTHTHHAWGKRFININAI